MTNILLDAHKLLTERMAARLGVKRYRPARSNHGVFCPYALIKDQFNIVSIKDLSLNLSWDVIEFAPIARDSSEYGFSDPFAWIDRKYRISFTALKMLTQLTKPTKILIKTHSDLIACDEYIEVLAELVSQGNDVEIQLTTVWGLDPDDARILIPCGPSEKRLQNAYERLKQLVFNVKRVNLSGKEIV